MFKQNSDNDLDPSPRLNIKPTQYRHERLVCAFCGYEITEHSAAIDVGGYHTHTCTNPIGVTFRIGCFIHAQGCRMAGDPTYSYTWFNGYQWRYALCDQCQTHLGWKFLRPSNTFFGLILNKLVSREHD